MAACAAAGTRLRLAARLVFAVGGVGDLIWHELFGIEDGFEALLSPTHLALILGLALIVSGPLRAAWQRSGRRPSWRTLGPALLSLTALISALTFITMYAHPIVFGIAGADHYEFNSEIGQIAGVLGMVVTSAYFGCIDIAHVAAMDIAARQFDTGVGPKPNRHDGAQLSSYLHRLPICVMLGAILLIDLLRIRLQPSLRNQGGWRVFAFIAPTLYSGSYIVAVLLTEGSVWSVHMLTGAVVLCGVTGWLISYLLLPPRMPVESGRYLS